MSKETMQDTVNMLSTPPRRNRFNLGNNHANSMNDDSPVLSQEPINISWKWNNEGTPIRSGNKSSKLRRSVTNNSVQLQNLHRLTKSGNATATTSSPKLERETHSPKGLYKFQEEMRKIQFNTESDTLCDNINDKSMTADTGYPTNMEGTDQADIQMNDQSSDNLVEVQVTENQQIQMISTQCDKHGVDDALANDLFNDSDFDQILLTCKMPAQNVTATGNAEANKTSVKKVDSTSDIKPSGSSNSSGSNWELIDDDCFDDLVKDFDVDIPVNLMNTSAKFTRHKSMPQQPQSPATSNSKAYVPQQATFNQNINNRKSFTRHESMPITNFCPPVMHNNNNNFAYQNSGKLF